MVGPQGGNFRGSHSSCGAGGIANGLNWGKYAKRGNYRPASLPAADGGDEANFEGGRDGVRGTIAPLLGEDRATSKTPREACRGRQFLSTCVRGRLAKCCRPKSYQNASAHAEGTFWPSSGEGRLDVGKRSPETRDHHEALVRWALLARSASEGVVDDETGATIGRGARFDS
jgi:hypothetical protein